MMTLHLMPARAKRAFEALGELGLAHARKAGHVHRNAGLQADRDELNELREFHWSKARSV